MNWEFIIAGTALAGSLFSIGFAYFRTRKTDKEKIEEFRQRLKVRADTYLTELNILIDKINTNIGLGLAIQFTQDRTKNNIRDIISEQINNTDAIIIELSDVSKDNKIDKLRAAEIRLNKIEIHWNEIKRRLANYNYS